MNLQGKQKLAGKAGVKLQHLTGGGGTTFGSSYWKGSRNQDFTVVLQLCAVNKMHTVTKYEAPSS